MNRSILGVAALAAAVACGGGQTRSNLFSTDWEDDGGASIARVWQRVGGATVPRSAEVAIGVAGDADRMIGLPLDGGPKWTFAHPLDARPAVAGGVVIASGGGEVFALDASSGRLVWRRPGGGLRLVGAGDDGTVTVTVLRKPGGTGSVLLAVTHDGQVVRQVDTSRSLGAPAVLQRLAFVPWSGQYVSVLDVVNGDEAARVTLRDETSRAWTQGGSLWFGGGAFTRFDERIRDASKGKASRASIATRDLPGTPQLVPSGNAPVPAVAGAEDRVRAYARPIASASGAVIEDHRTYATYFRIAMGFDADKAKLTWVRLNGPSFVGGAAESGGVILCDEDGKITEIDGRTGGAVSTMDFGEPVKSCVVSVDARKVGGASEEVKGLPAQLAEAVLAGDPQLVAAQKMLLRELSALPADSATKALVELASDPRTSPALLADARSALAARRTGATYMVAALGRHYDFLKDVLLAPPVGPLAHALGAMKERAAAPYLAAHLFDPADTDDDVKEAAEALAAVGGASELPAMKQFFGMYRANASNDDMAAAVVSIARALLQIDGKAGRAALEAAAKDPMTAGEVRDRLGVMLRGPAAPAPAR